MKDSAAPSARWSSALRRTLRDLEILLLIACGYWLLTGATPQAAVWAGLWLVLITAAMFGLNWQYAHRRRSPLPVTTPRRRLVAGTQGRRSAETPRVSASIPPLRRSRVCDEP
jgi:uncharacterized membrane protein YgcG